MEGRIRIGVVTAIMLLALVVIAMVAAAQQDKPASPPAPMAPGQMGGPGMMGRGMMGGGMGMMGMSPMPCAMMGGMMGRSAIAVSGGNVYVLAGNKVMKYDANLRLVKEAEIKMDTAKMQKMAEQCMQACPMQPPMPGGVMGEGGMMGPPAPEK